MILIKLKLFYLIIACFNQFLFISYTQISLIILFFEYLLLLFIINIDISDIAVWKSKYIIYMAEILIKQGTFFHHVLLEELNLNTENVIELKKLSEGILDATTAYGKSITHTLRSFLKYKKDKQHVLDDGTYSLNMHLIQTLSQLLQKVNTASKKIENQIVQPLEQFLASHLLLNKNILQRSSEMLSEIQANAFFLTQLLKNYGNNQDVKLSEQQKRQFKIIYEDEINKCNQKWYDIKKAYRHILTESDYTNSSRVIFTNKIQTKMIECLNKILNSSLVAQRLKQIEEDVFVENEYFSVKVKDLIREQIGRSNLLQQRSIQDILKNKLSTQETEKINKFIQEFTSRSGVKNERQNFQNARILILQDLQWSLYFLQRLHHNIHTQIKLPNIKYHQLTTIIKYIFASTVEADENTQLMYHILYVSYRISSNNGNYIIQEIGKYQQFWNDTSRWISLIQYMKALQKPVSNKSINGRKKQNLTSWVNKILIRPKKKTTEKQIKSEKYLNDSKDAQVLHEINYYMARLELKEQFIFSFIILACNKYYISKEITEKLLKFHYMNKRNNVNKLDNNKIRQKKLEDTLRNISRISQKSALCVGKCLKYLPLGTQLVNLRLVCKKWSKMLQKKIYERYLIHQFNHHFIDKNRLKIYKSLCPTAFDRSVFKRMITQMPSFAQHYDIILLDVKRSLNWDETLRQKLVQILKTYSFYHPDVGYLQGMNYLCQNILKLTDDSYDVYCIFQYMMNYHFNGLYTYNFDPLRVKLYQFMRILQKQLPKLYDHFQAQKVQGEHFLLSWAITLWGQMPGYLCWVMWDGFLISGWKWWIKTTIWLMKILQSELMNMNFEEIMKCFSELSTNLLSANFDDLSQFGIDCKNIKTEIAQIRIQNQTLKDIETEYKLKVSLVRECMKKILL